MSRLGCLILLVILLIVGGFALLVHKGYGPMVRQGTPAAPAATSTTASPTSGASATAMAAGGGLIIPVAGVKVDQLVNSWGDARGDGTRQHHAIDIMAARGTPVLAAAAGTVEKIFESKNGGHTVYIRRDDAAWQDYYAHLDTYAPDLREGIKVSQGQQIGAVGSSGDADPGAPHLHYEIHRMQPGDGWWKGTEINPYTVLKGLPG